ncbi:MAG TPA: site-2 protease family protein, partial [Phycisphaerae bacterium]|nr:site-2 protease family protein [Phycisphaerae bacterium]
SPADEANLQPGDVLFQYGDERNLTKLRLDEINRQAVGAGTSLVVLRKGQPVLVQVKPRGRGKRAQMGIGLDVDLLNPVVGGVRPSSPAARAGIAAGDLISEINGRTVASWIDVFDALKLLSGQEVTIGYRRGETPLTAGIGKLTPEAFDPDDYEYRLLQDVPFEPFTVRIVKANPAAAVGWGVNQTWEFVIMSYGTLRQLVGGRVSKDDLAGPLGIGHMAVAASRRGIIYLVYFMAMISAVVAVMNFLPFPMLDGGHAVLLIVEKIRGRPLPPKVMWAIQLCGLLCLLAVFLLLTWNDLMRIIRGMW